jgi:hypothetical protein
MFHTLLQTAPEITPFSAYLLCYFPLAAIVLGLLAFFVLTDAHARRPYLRFNPFVAYRSPPEAVAERPPQSGETAAGTLGAARSDAPAVYDATQNTIVAPGADEVSPSVQRAAAAEESVGEIVPPQPIDNPAVAEKLEEPPSTDPDEPRGYV